nr:MAG TPA: hypothetical protein [Caudoviricetes sp.]
MNQSVPLWYNRINMGGKCRYYDVSHLFCY